MNVKTLIPLLMLIVLSGAIPLYYDYMLEVFESWRSGESKTLIVLDINVPRVDADKCVLAVMRHPSIYLPSNGTLERLYRGVVSPGSTVTVRKFIPAIPVKTRYDETRKSYIVEYYEPQEFLVMVHCVKGNTTVFKLGRNIEVYPRNLVHREVVDIAALAEKYREETPVQQLAYYDGGSSTTFSCNITITESQYGDYQRGECYTYVAGPYLYSVNGLATSFGLAYDPASGKRSAVYLKAYADSEFCTLATIGLGRCRTTPEWHSVGKWLTSSIIGTETTPLTDNNKIQIYFYVKYVYEYEVWCDTFTGSCTYYWFLYPAEIGGLNRADYLGVGRVESYTPPSTPPYYARQNAFSAIIGFIPTYESDYPLAATSVSFTFSYTYPATWSVTLTIDFYKAGRSDNQYGTPYVSVSVPGYYPYYYWYRDNDPMTYEILFKSRS